MDNVVHEFMERRAAEMGLSLEPDNVDEEEAELWEARRRGRLEYEAMVAAIAQPMVSHYAGPGKTRISIRRTGVRPWFVVMQEVMADQEGWRRVVTGALRRYNMISELCLQHADRRPDFISDATWRAVVSMSLRGVVRDITSGA